MGLAIGNAVALSIPVVGGDVAMPRSGAASSRRSDAFMSRLFIAHVFILPALDRGA